MEYHGDVQQGVGSTMVMDSVLNCSGDGQHGVQNSIPYTGQHGPVWNTTGV